VGGDKVCVDYVGASSDSTHRDGLIQTVQLLRDIIAEDVAEVAVAGNESGNGDEVMVEALPCDTRLINPRCFERADARALLERGVLVELGGSVSLEPNPSGGRRYRVALNCAIIPLGAGHARPDKPPAWTLWERSLHADVDIMTLRKEAAGHDEIAALVLIALAERFVQRDSFSSAVRYYCLACNKLVSAGAAHPDAPLHTLYTYVRKAAADAWAREPKETAPLRGAAPDSTRRNPCGCGGR